jgi:hypothetical protein
MRIGRFACCGALGLALIGLLSCRASEPAAVTVYKTATCSCCSKWVDHLEAGGLRVKSVDVEDLSWVKKEHGVPTRLAACHTALVDGYVVEGHVPVEDVLRLLAERPDVVGIAVPRMPIGSPGMEGPNPEPYEVLAFGRDGSTRIFASHTP